MADYIRNKDVSCCVYCGKTKLYAKGMCRNCYTRALKHNGDPSYIFREPKQEYIETQQMSWQRKLVIDVLGYIPEDNTELEKSIDCVVATLSKKLQKIIDLRYKENLTLREVGRIFNVTQERIRQLQNKALRRLRYQDRANVIIYGEKIASQKANEQKASADKECLKIPNCKYIVKEDMTMRELLEKSYPSIISTRAFNCLFRSLYLEGLNDEISVSEFVDFISKKNISLEEYITNIHNCGAHSTMELINMMDRVVTIRYE